ncbi:MAG: inositol monophosphatase family protein [Gemmatimonadaceae bacterium]
MSTRNDLQPSIDHEGLLGVAITAAEDAAAIIRGRVADAASMEWRQKSPADFVSEVDTSAEAAIREAILRDVPDAIVIAEEGSPGAAIGDAPTFIVDPLDGTTNFLHGFPAYAVSIGVLANRAIVAGVIIDVPMRDIYTARAGNGAFRNGEHIRVSSITDPSHALIGTGFPFRNVEMLDVYQRQFAKVTRHTAGIRRPGSAALDLANVACGRFDGFWELNLMSWDYAAGMLLVQEAGGVVTEASGGSPTFGESAIVAGNRVLHAWLLDLIAADTR